MSSKTERIRALNDRLRTTGLGGDIVVTQGLASLDTVIVAAVFARVQSFTEFTPDNDPRGEHDFGLLIVEEPKIMFQIDYYDRQMGLHSPDPSDEVVTRRVLTIMLADEY